MPSASSGSALSHAGSLFDLEVRVFMVRISYRQKPGRRILMETFGEFIAVEPDVCPTLTGGNLMYDHGDSVGLTPLLYMRSLGKEFVPPPIHAGGLRYHGMAPLVSHLVRKGIVTPRAYGQEKVILFNLSGHGFLDIQAYDRNGKRPALSGGKKRRVSHRQNFPVLLK